jgi:hypothetical protein
MALVLPAVMTGLGSCQAHHAAVANVAASATDGLILPQLNSGDGTLDVSFLDNLAVRKVALPGTSSAGGACAAQQHGKGELSTCCILLMAPLLLQQDEMDTWQLDNLDGLDTSGFLGPGSTEAAFSGPGMALPDAPSVTAQRTAVPASAFSSTPDGEPQAGLVQLVQQAAPLPPFPPSSAASPGPGLRPDMPPLPLPQSVRAASSAHGYGGPGFRSDAGTRMHSPQSSGRPTPRISRYPRKRAA